MAAVRFVVVGVRGPVSGVAKLVAGTGTVGIVVGAGPDPVGVDIEGIAAPGFNANEEPDPGAGAPGIAGCGDGFAGLIAIGGVDG